MLFYEPRFPLENKTKLNKNMWLPHEDNNIQYYDKF